MSTAFAAVALFVVTALAEIAGCFLVHQWLVRGKSAWLVPPAAGCLALFAWLLTLHPAAAGRTYAAYGCVYVAASVAWLWGVEGVRPTFWDLTGAAIAFAGMAAIIAQPSR